MITGVERKLLSDRLSWSDKNISIETGMTSPRAKSAIKKVREKVAKGVYSFENVSCYCGAGGGILISETDRYGFYYPMVICKRCGLMRASPRMTEKSYREFYAHEYRDVYGEGDKNIAELFGYRIKQGKEKYGYFMNSLNLPANAVIFDIGCDFGTMLLPFAGDGYEVYGCDYGIEHIEYGRAKMHLKNLLIGGPEKLQELGKKADFIILNHVIEHFLDLEVTLTAVHELLNPGGVCYVAVPGVYGRIGSKFGGRNNILPLLQNAHTYQFNLATLKYVMECCGFGFVRGDEQIESFFEYSGCYREKADYPEAEFWILIKFLQSVERKFLIERKIVRWMEFIRAKNLLKNMFGKRWRRNVL